MEAITTTCRICAASLGGALYRSPGNCSVTSLCGLLPQSVTVHFCAHCGHLQSNELGSLPDFYATEYKILIGSEEEDQLYQVTTEGRKVFRTEHQVETLLQKVPLPDRARVLDYGCAKSSTLRALVQRRPDLVPHVFDVSAMYEPFWEQFVPAENQATFAPKPEWKESFDLVTSFFALEHVADPRGFVRSVTSLLHQGGIFYCLVPNVYANTADLVVADHVNHFSESSLRLLFATEGLEIIEATASAHTSAWVVVAKKATNAQPVSDGMEVQRLAASATAMASYWRDFTGRVLAFEASVAGKPSAIYGSGFYGTFIATCLTSLDPVRCFLDQNPHRQKHQLMAKGILPPDALPPEVQVVYVGLNPLISRTVAELPNFRARGLEYFFT